MTRDELIAANRRISMNVETIVKHLRNGGYDEDAATLEALLQHVRVLETAHEENAAEVYKDRETVTPDVAWEAFKRSNATVCRMAERSRAALKARGGEG